MNAKLVLASTVLSVALSGCAGTKTADAITFDIATMRNVTRVTDSGLDKSTLAVSPDGSKILYGEAKSKKGGYGDFQIKDRTHLFVITEDGSGLMQITSGNVDVYSPTWGINDEVYFISNVSNATEIWKATLVLP